MKNIKYHIVIGLIILLTTASQTANAQKDRVVNLRGKWYFQLGDNEKYADSNYDHSNWEKIAVPSSWQSEGFRNYTGYAWYRTTFELDDKVDTRALFLRLGEIDDCDEVFLNGHYIGGIGGFPPNYFTAYNVDRNYFINEEYLNEKGENVIAVRVFDEGGVGGIMGRDVGIYQTQLYTENCISLIGNWKFSLFDNEVNSKKNLDDSSWENIIVPSSWERQGFTEYDGFAWYRKTFKIPSDYTGKDMILILGKIDDMDETFINGVRVGSTGDIESKWARNEEWNKYRIYYIPNGLLKKGASNTIAVRVYDQEQRGGIYEDPLVIIPRTEYKQFWKEYYKHKNVFFDWVASFQY